MSDPLETTEARECVARRTPLFTPVCPARDSAACYTTGDCWDAQLALIEADHDAHADEMAAAGAECLSPAAPRGAGAPPFYCVAGCGCEVTYPNWHCGECEYEEHHTP